MKKCQINTTKSYLSQGMLALAEVLKRREDEKISQDAVNNPNCPPEILTEVLKKGNKNWISFYAARNPNCPPEILNEVLKRNNDFHISMNAALNPNCPPKARLDWLEATGQLTKYDPDRFELEKVPEDKDLEELRKLIS